MIMISVITMTVEIENISSDLAYRKKREKVDRKIQELNREVGRRANGQECLRIARDMIEEFTVRELSDLSRVSKTKTEEVVDYWIAMDDVEISDTTSYGTRIYAVN